MGNWITTEVGSSAISVQHGFMAPVLFIFLKKILLCVCSWSFGKFQQKAGLNKATFIVTALCNLMLSGKVNTVVLPILYVEHFCFFNKMGGEIWLIAVVTTYRRLTAKLACGSVLEATG